jgi:hypothetical protein
MLDKFVCPTADIWEEFEGLMSVKYKADSPCSLIQNITKIPIIDTYDNLHADSLTYFCGEICFDRKCNLTDNQIIHEISKFFKVLETEIIAFAKKHEMIKDKMPKKEKEVRREIVKSIESLSHADLVKLRSFINGRLG